MSKNKKTLSPAALSAAEERRKLRLAELELNELEDELGEIEDELEDDEKVENQVIPMDSEETNENEIAFAIVRDVHEYGEYTCPYCKHTDQIAIRSFTRIQYKDFICNKCGKEFLMRLVFNLELKSYVVPGE